MKLPANGVFKEILVFANAYYYIDEVAFRGQKMFEVEEKKRKCKVSLRVTSAT